MGLHQLVVGGSSGPGQSLLCLFFRENIKHQINQPFICFKSCHLTLFLLLMKPNSKRPVRTIILPTGQKLLFQVQAWAKRRKVKSRVEKNSGQMPTTKQNETKPKQNRNKRKKRVSVSIPVWNFGPSRIVCLERSASSWWTKMKKNLRRSDLVLNERSLFWVSYRYCWVLQSRRRPL